MNMRWRIATVALALLGVITSAWAAPAPAPAPKAPQGRVVAYGGISYDFYVPAMDVPPEALSEVWGASTGDRFSMAIYGKSRKVVEWPPANYTYGQLAPLYPASTQRPKPKSLTGVVAVAAGEHHSLALTKTGKVVFWTRLLFGGGVDDLPALLAPKAKAKVKAIAAGRGGYSMALLNNGSIIEWGPLRNYSDNSTWYRAPPPGLVLPFAGDNSSALVPRLRAKAIAAGWDHSLALLDNGTVVAWGGKRGIPGSSVVLRALNVPLDARQDVVAIAAGNQHSLALLANGTVVAWGVTLSNVYGATCAAESCRSAPPPPAGPNNVPAEGLRDVVAIAAGNQFAMAVVKGGRVVVWGRTLMGGSRYLQNVPDDALSGVFAVSGSSYHWLAVKAPAG